MYKILEKDGVDNESIDGAAFNNFSAGNRDGIIGGVLSECSFSSMGNGIIVNSGELLIHGVRVKLTSAETLYVSSVPIEETRYQIVAQVNISDNKITGFDLFIQLPKNFVQDEFYKDGNGIYQIEVGRFTHNPDGTITDLTKTVDIIYGSAGGGTAFEVGNIVVQSIPNGNPPEVDINKRVENGKEYLDFDFGIPEGNSATDAEAVHYTPQELSDAQKKQARENIGAVSSDDLIESEEQTGEFITGNNTLKNAIASLNVVSKNILPFPYYNRNAHIGSGETYTENGITFTVNEDGGISINGTATAAADLFLFYKKNNIPNYTPNTFITVSLNPTSTVGSSVKFRINAGDTGGLTNDIFDTPQTISYPNVLNYGVITVASGSTISDLTVYPQIEEGETATAYTPFVSDDTSAEITACGKNLIPFPYSNISGTVNNGITFTVNSDNSITLNGTATGTTSSFFNLAFKKEFLKPGKYICSCKNSTSQIRVVLRKNNSAWIDITGSPKIAIIESDDTLSQVGISVQPGTTCDNVTLYPQIEQGETATDFEPYQSQSFSTEVGQTIDVTQYEGVTNVFSQADGVAISGKFIQSTQDELNTKPTTLIGKFANRPTQTFDYPLIYLAEDQQGNERATYLKPNSDGSVSENWTSLFNNLIANYNNSATGWIELVNGLKIQWSPYTATTNPHKIVYPVPFKEYVSAVIAQPANATSANTVVSVAGTSSLTGFDLYYGTEIPTSEMAQSGFYIAIGV